MTPPVQGAESYGVSRSNKPASAEKTFEDIGNAEVVGHAERSVGPDHEFVDGPFVPTMNGLPIVDSGDAASRHSMTSVTSGPSPATAPPQAGGLNRA